MSTSKKFKDYYQETKEKIEQKINIFNKDLTNDENWGTVWRNGINQLIIIDSGFSEDVWEKYYTTA